MKNLTNKILISLYAIALVVDLFLESQLPSGSNYAIGLGPALGLGALGPALGLTAGGIAGLLQDDERTVRQQPLETPEQTQTRRRLLEIAESGQFGDLILGSPISGVRPGETLPGLPFGTELPGFQAGTDLGLPLGAFDVTGTERLGLGGIEQLLGSVGQQPGILDTTSAALEDIIQGADFDPSGQFEPFRTRVERELEDRSEALKRQAAFTGNLFSTDTVQRLGDVQARGTEAIASELGRLQSEALNRRFAAIPVALQQAGLEDQLELGRLLPGIQAALQFGGLERDLADIEARRGFDEALRQRGELQSDLLRRRGEERSEAIRRRDETLEDAARRRREELLRLDLLGTVLGSNAQFGIPEITVPQQNEFEPLLNLLAQFGGSFLGNRLAVNQARGL